MSISVLLAMHGIHPRDFPRKEMMEENDPFSSASLEMAQKLSEILKTRI